MRRHQDAGPLGWLGLEGAVRGEPAGWDWCPCEKRQQRDFLSPMLYRPGGGLSPGAEHPASRTVRNTLLPFSPARRRGFVTTAELTETRVSPRASDCFCNVPIRNIQAYEVIRSKTSREKKHTHSICGQSQNLKQPHFLCSKRKVTKGIRKLEPIKREHIPELKHTITRIKNN